jgi:7,8-dihydropterin-6-yl-methyl-4-(beta-D-ribofuranosyl)aminobenzene 5'-phosphate synthase
VTYRITIICENSVGPITGALGEHGFAALIEPSEGAPLLFDTWQGLTLLHNARRSFPGQTGGYLARSL